MNATPFFIAATASMILPPILSLIHGAKRLITLFIVTMTLWLIIMVIPVVTRANWPVITITILIMIAANFAEYVLIGTLMSFGSTIVIGIIITRFM